MNKSYYILTNKVTKEKLENGVTFQYANTNEDVITLYATTKLNITPKYKMFLHLYEHLLFNNIYIDGVVYKKMEDILKLCEAHNIDINAFTFDDGIVIHTKINTSGLKAKLGKGVRSIDWLSNDKEIIKTVNLAAKIIYGILVNRDRITDDIINKEIEIIRSEICNTRNNKYDMTVRLKKEIYKDYESVLGTSEYIDKLGKDNIRNFIKELDEEFLNPKRITFEIVYNMNQFGDVDLETIEIAKVFKELALLKENKFNRNLNGDTSKFENVITYKDIQEDIVLDDQELNVITLIADMNPKEPIKTLDEYIQMKIYSKMLLLSIVGFNYGIFNYLREEKSACYTSYGLGSLPDSLLKYNIKNMDNPEKFHNRLGSLFIINETFNMDELLIDLKRFIKEWTISEEVFNQIKITYRNGIQASLKDEPDYYLINIFDILYEHFTSLGELQVTQKLETLFTYNPNLLSYEEFLKYFNSFKEKVKFISMKKSK